MNNHSEVNTFTDSDTQSISLINNKQNIKIIDKKGRELYFKVIGADMGRLMVINCNDGVYKNTFFFITGADIQGGNTSFQLFMDSTNNANADQTYLTMMGTYDKSKGKGKKLVNGFQYDQKKYGITSSPDQKIDVVMSDDDLRGIFQMYSGAGKKNVPDKQAKGGTAKTTYNQGGRVENRKYFTLNWAEPIDYEDPEIAFLLSDMYYSAEESFYKRKEICN